MVKLHHHTTVINEDNFAVIYQDYYGLLIKYTYVIVKNKELAQDIVADLFCELWNARNKINIHTNLQAYLLVSARRMANKQLAKPVIDLGWGDRSATIEEDPHTKFIHKETALLLEQLFAGLSSQKKDIVQLRIVGLTYAEIAATLGITAKKVEYHLLTAIALLHEEVKSKPHFKELAFLLLLPQLIHEVTIW